MYSPGKCADVLNRAAVLIHGRTTTGPVAFDLRQRAPGGESPSVQKGLALAGIDAFAPSLLGYGRSTRFGMDDPANASVRAYESDGTTCNYQADGGCDRTNNPIWSLDQQGTVLFVNPLAGQRRPHSSNARFARTDVWVRDVRQVVDDAITRAQPTDGKPGGVLVAVLRRTDRRSPPAIRPRSYSVFSSQIRCLRVFNCGYSEIMVDALIGTEMEKAVLQAAGQRRRGDERSEGRRADGPDAELARRRAQEAGMRARRAAEKAAASFAVSARLHDRVAALDPRDDGESVQRHRNYAREDWRMAELKRREAAAE